MGLGKFGNWNMILGIFSQFSAAQREKLVTQLAKKSQSLGDKFS